MIGATTNPVTEEPDAAAAVAARVRDAVRAAPVSQRKFADRIGMDPTALSKALRGTRRLREDELAAIAKAAKVTQRYLLTGVGRGPAVHDGGRARADALDPDVRRTQILEATARLIARRGFHNVRVADIAEACGTSTGTVHYHFPAKDDALRAALDYYADVFHRRLDEAFATTDSTVEKLRLLIDVQLPVSDADIDEWSIWVQAWNEAILDPSQRPGQREIYSRWRQVVLDLVRAYQREGIATDADADALTDRFTSMVDGLAIQVLAQTTEMSVPRMRALLLDAFEPHIRLRGPA
ncbi:MAG TPA: TetR/AcrR family transcriptional regulator [Pseudonocardia sp.]|nr:TetR/AcrR family transcriptional regulator [Pseudonocardia sp.]